MERSKNTDLHVFLPPNALGTRDIPRTGSLPIALKAIDQATSIHIGVDWDFRSDYAETSTLLPLRAAPRLRSFILQDCRIGQRHTPHVMFEPKDHDSFKLERFKFVAMLSGLLHHNIPKKHLKEMIIKDAAPIADFDQFIENLPCLRKLEIGPTSLPSTILLSSSTLEILNITHQPPSLVAVLHRRRTVSFIFGSLPQLRHLVLRTGLIESIQWSDLSNLRSVALSAVRSNVQKLADLLKCASNLVAIEVGDTTAVALFDHILPDMTGLDGGSVPYLTHSRLRCIRIIWVWRGHSEEIGQLESPSYAQETGNTFGARLKTLSNGCERISVFGAGGESGVVGRI